MTELPALRLSVYVGEDDTWHGRPLTTEIVHRAHHMGLSGATVLRGVEGYGASSHIHTTRLLSLTSQLPMVVVIVDVPERVRAFLPVLAEIVPSGISVLDEVTMIRYGPPA